MEIPARGARVLGETDDGWWVRGETAGREGDHIRVRFDTRREPEWFFPLRYVKRDGPHEPVLPPERIALIPPARPGAFPEPGAPVVAFWDRQRWHAGRFVESLGDRWGKVAFDDGDHAWFSPATVLPRGTVPPAERRALERRGLGLRATVVAQVSAGPPRMGWVARHGNGRVYVRFIGRSDGVWLPAGRVKPAVGTFAPPPVAEGALVPGARVEVCDASRTPVHGVIRKTRHRHGLERAEVILDGESLWLARERIRALEPPREQADPDAPSPLPALDLDAAILFEDAAGQHRTGTVVTARGAQVFVLYRSKRGKERNEWVGLGAIAQPLPLEAPFPPVGSRIRVATGEGKRRSWVAATARRAERGRLTATPARGEGLLRADADAIAVERWGQGERPLPAGERFSVGAAVRVEKTPLLFEPGTVTGSRGPRLLLVRMANGRVEPVDPARLQAAPAPAPPPEAPPPPAVAEPEPAAPAEPTEPTEPEQVRQILRRWIQGGYRGAELAAWLDDDGRGARLPVSVGQLTFRLVDRGVLTELSVVASAPDLLPEEPPPPTLVRLARRLADLFGGAEASLERVAEEQAWAQALCAPHAFEVERAGGALLLCVRAPAIGADDACAWGRAVHRRFCATEGLEPSPSE